MAVPHHLLRFPTRAAIEALANRFDLPNSSEMQDWEFEVADAERIDEFVAAYDSGDLSDDERFTLMDVILQSFEDSGIDLANHVGWKHVQDLLDRNIELHIHSVWYWSDTETKDPQDAWRITPFMRQLLERHRRRFD